MRILVVEDENKLAQAVKRALELQSHAVDLALDGELGLDLALGEAYDLVILDLMLPKLNGLEVCQRLRQEKNTVPVLILTAKDQISDKVSGLDAGADDYLVKPFSFEELFARIRALSRRTGPVSEPQLKVGDLILESDKLKVHRRNRPIKLSSKEFAILEYLMRHQNNVVTREQLILHVWNYDASILPTTVEVHIKHLRDKIDRDEAIALIKTVHGFGYEISDKD